MFSVSYQQDLTKTLFIRCLFMQKVLQVPCNGQQSLLSRLCKKKGDHEITHDFYMYHMPKYMYCLFQLIVFSVG